MLPAVIGPFQGHQTHAGSPGRGGAEFRVLSIVDGYTEERGGPKTP